jgi:hypothetical protein
VECKLAHPHRHQTRLRGLDEPQTKLAVINEEEDSDTEVSGSWAAPIPRYDNHEVGPRIDIWAEEEAMASLSTERNSRKLFSGDREGPPLRHLKQMHAAQDVGIKLRPTAVNLTPMTGSFCLQICWKAGPAPKRINSKSGCRRSWTYATQWNWRSTRNLWRCTPCK